MMRVLRQCTNLMNRNAPTILATGLAGIVWHNWRLWQRDKALADRLQRERQTLPVLSRTPKISVLVAAWNEGARIDDHLRSFLALTYPQIELVLCAGGSDNTLVRAQRYASERVIVLEQRPGEGKQRALARCYAQATGEMIYLTDADCIFNNEALVRLIDPIINEGEQAATGTIRPLDEQLDKPLPDYIWTLDVVRGAQTGTYTTGLRGASAMLTRRAIEGIGGLHFAARTGTDYQLARRLLRQGLAIRYVDSAVIASEYAETLREHRQRQSRWLRNLLVHGWRDGAISDVVVTLRTIGVGVVMLLAPALPGPIGKIARMPWALLLVHAILSKVRYARFAAQLHGHALPKRRLLALPALALIDFAVWASPIVDMLSVQRRNRW